MIKILYILIFTLPLITSCSDENKYSKYTYEAKMDSLIIAIVNTKDIYCGKDSVLYFVSDSLFKSGKVLKRNDGVPVKVLYTAEDKNRRNGHLFIEGNKMKSDSLSAHLDFNYTDFCCSYESNADYIFIPDSCRWRNVASETSCQLIVWGNDGLCDSLYGKKIDKNQDSEKLYNRLRKKNQ